MTDKLTIYYSIANGGDGSAYPLWFDTEELARWHQDHIDPGWGESCDGSITIEGQELSCQEEIQTKEGFYLDLLLEGIDPDGATNLEGFVKDFFPDGLPEYRVEVFDEHYYGVFVGTQRVYKSLTYLEKKSTRAGAARLLKKIQQGTVDCEGDEDGQE